jgi:hypothetical protein
MNNYKSKNGLNDRRSNRSLREEHWQRASRRRHVEEPPTLREDDRSFEGAFEREADDDAMADTLRDPVLH